MTFKQEVAVTSLTFRTDAAAAELPLLASAGGTGRVCLWDLKERRLHHTMATHEGSISKLQFLPRCVHTCTCTRACTYTYVGERYGSGRQTPNVHEVFCSSDGAGYALTLLAAVTSHPGAEMLPHVHCSFDARNVSDSDGRNGMNGHRPLFRLYPPVAVRNLACGV